MSKPTRGERITAVTSTLVAIAILAAGVTAHQSRTASLDRISLLKADLLTQLDLAYSHNRRLLKQRTAAMDQVLDAWSDSAQSSDDRDLLAEWLERSIRNSMPGKVKPLPPIPEFARPSLPGAESPLTTELADTQTVAPPEAAATSLAAPADVATDIPASPPPSSRSEAPVGPVPTLADDPTNANTATPPVAARRPTSPAGQSLSPRDETAPLGRPATGRTAAAGLVDPDLLSQVRVSQATQRADRQVAPPAEVGINLAQLNAEIDRYNEALQALDRALGEATRDLNESQLGEWVDRLDTLSSQYGFLSLYFGALTEDERAIVALPRSPVPTTRLLQQRLDRLAAGRDGDFLRPFDPQRAPALQALDRRLQAIANIGTH